MTRTTWILVAILLALIGVAVLVLQQPGEQSVSSQEGEFLATYDSAAIDRMDIVLRAESITLQKEGTAWMLTSPLRAPADARSIANAIGKGKSTRLSGLISSNPEKQSLFQVDSSGTLVRMYEKGTERAAFRIGKPGPGYTDTYVRREGAIGVYLADGMLTQIFGKPSRDWRDKAILSITPEAVRSVRFHYGDTTFSLQAQDSLWSVDGVPATEHVVRSFLSALSALQADEFVDTALTGIPPLVGMLDVDGTQLGFHRVPGDNMMTVITSRTTQVYRIYSWRGDQVLKRKNDFITGQ